MFLISKDNHELEFKKFSSKFSFIRDLKPICMKIFHTGYYLHWVKIKPSDNLHIFKDGYVIGKISPNEKEDDSPKNKIDESIDSITLHPLSISTKVKVKDNVLFSPNQHHLLFYSSNLISDFQLLIAKVKSYNPDNARLITLSSVGYLPHNMTLFSQISMIPFLHDYDIFEKKLIKKYNFQLKLNNDSSMLDRLSEIIPTQNDTDLLMSAGLDSRFILGLLLKKKLNPRILHIKDIEKETKIVESITDKLKLEYYCPEKN